VTAETRIELKTEGGARRMAEALAPLLMLAGAGLAFFALTRDYYGVDSARGFGLGQWLALAAGLGAMAAAAAMDVFAGRRSIADTLRFWAVALQLALLVQVIRLYQIESRIFYDVVAYLLLFGFVAHHHLPGRFRPPFFFAVGLAAIVAVLGVARPDAAAWLIGLGLGLFAIANLPVALWLRVVMLLAAGAGLAALRLGWIETGWGAIVVPLLAAMFAFRLAIYLYDVHNKRGPKDLWTRLSYFFLPPNPVFPFFPVVDFAAFGRSYYNEEALRIYQRGAAWILRGVIHLLIYRLVYQNFAMAPESVETPAQFLAYIIFNFALYFRISGLFHLIIGLLLLFGFNLHETHSRFYFSNSFVDFWRRINIYWKEFVQKMFFNPAFVRLKKAGAPHIAGVLGAIAITFLATWALHSYQWFWLRGTVLLTWPDALFWALLAAFLMAQTYLEDRRQGVAAKPGLLGARAFLVMRTIATFLTICLLWSFWSSETLAAWFELLAASGVAPAFGAGPVSAADWARTLFSVAVAGFLVALTTGVTFGLGPHAVELRRKPKAKPAFAPAFALATAPVLALLALHFGPLKERLSVDVQLFVEAMSRNQLNARDQALMARGYYEDLTNTQRFNSPLWEVFTFRPNNFQDMEEVAGFRRRSDYLGNDYEPGATFSWHDVRYDINRWGMRDDDYELAKPQGVIRLALVEASRGSGLGVEQEQTFAALLERRLNAEAGEGRGYEVLNMSVEGHTPIQRLMMLEERTLRFSPDVVLYIGGIRDTPENHIAAMYRRGVEPPYPFISEVIARAGLDRAMSEARMRERLAPYRWEILGEVYRRFAEACRAHGATPVWFYLSGLHGRELEDAAVVERQRRLSAEAGFVILDMPDVFAGHALETLQIGPWDHAHPNPYGHALVADALQGALLDLDGAGAVDLGLAAGVSSR
jgi:D-alanyl-lipoteichoic acid acyltransferase DltB (MBOAT superfamily)